LRTLEKIFWLLFVVLASSGTGAAGAEAAAASPPSPEQAFRANCAKCHGVNGVPKSIAKGTLMPKFAHKLAPETVAALARYVRDIGAEAAQGPEGQPAGEGRDDR